MLKIRSFEFVVFLDPRCPQIHMHISGTAVFFPLDDSDQETVGNELENPVLELIGRR